MGNHSHNSKRERKALSSKNSEKLKKMIDESLVISFDFFDTLFTRPLAHPEDIFTLMAEQFSIPDFVKRRRKAQTKAFQQMNKRGLKEINLSDIYKCFETTSTPNDELMNAEYELELSLLVPIPEMFDLFLSLLADSDKIIVIVSDMYLKSDFFKTVLKNYNIDNVQLFVSSDYNATKRDSGELFERVITELDVLPESILHIGDNLLADVTQPQGKGISAFHYKDNRKRKEFKDYSPSLAISSGLFYTNTKEIEPDSFFSLGFRYGGPVQIGFLDWIKGRSYIDNVDHVLFLSRDGFSLNNIAKHQHNIDLPNYCYFLSSRTSLTLASMTAGNFEQFIPFLLSGSENLQARELLERIGVVPPSLKVMNDLGLGPNVSINHTLTDKLSDFLYAYQWEILKVCKSNRYALFNYLKQLGIKKGQRVALVDVGWNGSTQEAFERVVRELLDVEVLGYYFCLANTPTRTLREESQQMFSMINSDTVSANLVDNLYDYRVVIESFFSAPHDTVIGLSYNQGQSIEAVFDKGRGASGMNNKVLHDISKGIESYSQHYGNSFQQFNVQLSAFQLVSPIFELCIKDHRDLYFLSEMVNFDAWGSSRNLKLKLESYL